MLNVFLKYIIAIPLVIIFLMPVASSACENNMTLVLETYKYVLHSHMSTAEGLSKRDFSGECCQKDENINSTMYPCNNSMENVTHHNFNDGCCHFAGHIHTCSDSMELHYIFFMGCLLHQQTKAAKINKEFRCVLTQVTQYTEVALGCTHEKIIECKQNNKRRTKKKCSREICEIKETITKLRVCWNTFAKNLR